MLGLGFAYMYACSRARCVALLLATAAATGTPANWQGAAAQSADNAKVYTFNVPSQKIAQGVNAIGRAAGISVVINGKVDAGLTGQAVNGSMTAAQAFASFLSGTGLSYSFANANTVTVSGPGVEGNNSGATVEGAIALDTIDVSGGGAASADLPYETPGSTAHVSAEQLARVPYSTVGDIFKGVPGVLAAQGRNGAALNVNIRGLQGMNRVKTTVDGAEQSTSTYRGYFGVDNRTYVDPDLIGGIDVSKGPNGGASGAGAVGGVVAVRTLAADDIIKPGETSGVRIKAGAADNTVSPPAPSTLLARTDETGLFDSATASGSIAAAGRSDHMDVIAAFSRRKSGNYFAGTDGPLSYKNENGQSVAYAGGLSGAAVRPGGEVFNTSADVASGLVKATAHGEGHSLQLGYIYYDNVYGEVTPLMVQPGIFRQFDLSHTRVDNLSAKYRYNPTDNDLVDFRLNAWRTDLRETTNYFRERFSPPFYYIVPIAAASSSYGADASNMSRLGTSLGAIDINYGASFSIERAKPDGDYSSGALPSNGERQIGRLFANTEWRPSEWLKLNGGLSYDAYRVDDKWDFNVLRPFYPTWAPDYPTQEGNAVSPSAAVTLIPLEGLQLFALYAEGIRPPSLRESGANMSGLKPNPNLTHETSRNWELGTNVSKNNVINDGDNVRIKLTYFNNTVDDYIYRESVPRDKGSSDLTSMNMEKAKFSGYEAQISYTGSIVFAEVGASYYDKIEFCKVGEPCEARSPKTRDNVISDYSANYIPPKFMITETFGLRLFDGDMTIGTRITHATERAIPAAHGNVGDIAVVWPEFTTVDLFGSAKVTEQITLSISAENLQNKFYIDPLAGTRLPAPGRTIWTGVTANF